MATVTGLTAARMLAIEAASVVSGAIVGNDLILTKFDSSTVNAGNVRGATGPTGPDGNPIGTFIMGGWTAEPTNYKFLNGQTLVGGVAAYPAIATMFPAWVSSANLILPNAMAGAVPLGSTTGIGAVSGSMTHVLTEANLGSHTHTSAAHTHTGPSHTHTGPLHGHNFSGYVDNANATHTHSGAQAAGEIMSRDVAYNTGYTLTTGGLVAVNWMASTASANATHTHTYSGGTDQQGTGATGASGTAATGSGGAAATSAAGSGIAVDHTPKNLAVRWAVKVL
jgi:hypothetical protein